MEKIKALLEKAGCNPELVGSICESLDKYKTTLREQFESEYAAKVEQAKKVCIEETESHKRELSRRLQIYCETKGAAIEATLAKKSALNESEAVAKLRSIKGMLEGVESNSTPNGDVTATMEKAKRQIAIANEERQRAIEKANRQSAIAERALKKNRELSAENVRLGKIVEGKRGRQPVTEGKRKRQRQDTRIDGQRNRGGRPVSTRSTIVENQDRRPPAKPANPHVAGTGTGSGQGYGVDDIAANMDDDLL